MRIIILRKVMWGPLKHWGLKWDPGSYKTLKKNYTLGVPIRYQVLNDEDLTNVDALRIDVIA